MKTNTQIVTEFYTAFQNKDSKTMTSLYAENISFTDPAFGTLIGEDAKNMWRMLCENATDLKITFEVLEASSNMVKAHWEANYTFSRTGNRVHNKIDASLTIKEGLIESHVDQFNLWVWSQQALGTSGWLLGWSGAFKSKLQKQTKKLLANYKSKY